MIKKVGSLFAIFLMLIMFSSVVTPNLNASAQVLPPLSDLSAENDGSLLVPLHIGENPPAPLTIDAQGNDVINLPDSFDNVIVTSPLHGTVNANSGDTTYIDYHPALNYFGPDSFTYKLCTPDNSICSSNTATVFIMVDQTSGNSPPIAVPDRYTIPAGSQGIILNVIANDTDPENDPIHIVSYTGPACAGVQLNPDNTFTWNAYDDLCTGPNTFSYTIDDNQPHGTPLPQQTTTVSIQITPVNHPPSTENISPVTNQNSPVTFNLIGHHTDTDPLTYTILTLPSHGILSGTAPDPSHGILSGTNPTLTYTPNHNYFGLDSFTYKASDSTSDSNISTVSISVNHVNQPPVATPDRYSVIENTPLVMNVLANDTDPDIPNPGDALKVQSFTSPLHGTLVKNLDNTLTYTPSLNYFGPDSFTITISDSAGLTSTSMVTMTVGHVNQPPVAVDDTASTVTNKPVLVRVLTNDNDPDIPTPGDTIVVQSVTSPSHGTAVRNVNNTITYTPTIGYTGSDSFRYTISDIAGLTSTATVNVNIGVANSPPVAPNHTETLIPGQTFAIFAPLGAAYDPDHGDTISLTSYSNPSHGTTVRNPDNTITYTPTPGYYGSDSFTYTVTDNHGAASTGTYFITIVKPNSPPVAVNDVATTVINAPVVIKVLANDSDPDAGDTISIQSVTNPSHGVIVVNPDNTITYTPTTGYTGSDSFTYTISDNHGATATANVAITILKSTPGEIEGEGEIGKNTHFEFKVESDDGIKIKGHLQYHDKKKIDLESTSFTTIYVDSTGTQGGFSGIGKIKGHDGYTFQVAVTDNGPRNHNTDTFSITVFDPSGHSYYSKSGTLTKGDIEINDNDDHDEDHGDGHGDDHHDDGHK